MALEGMITPSNPATKYAHDLINKFRQKREDEKEIENQAKLWPEYIMCNDCKRKGNKTKYHRDTMLHTPYISNRIRRGRHEKITIYVHRCQKCKKTYKPQQGRSGHVNGV
jgi:hypothetical protein